jgi:predicted nuclease of predicted toxin-antitoxin system
VRFLLDQNLSLWLAARLNKDGHDAVHIHEYGMDREKDDNKILDRAAAENRIFISRDTDCGKFLHARGRSRPSVILLPQRASPNRPATQHALLRSKLPALRRSLQKGSHVTFRSVGERTTLEVHRLPLRYPLRLSRSRGRVRQR